MQSQQKAGFNPLVFLLIPACAIVLVAIGQPPGPAPQVGVSVAPMIDDPEAETTTFEDEVWAGNQALANQYCQEMAERFSLRGGGRVVVVGVRKLFDNRYQCRFMGENHDAGYADDLFN